MRRWRSSAAYRIAFINLGAFAAGLALLGLAVFALMHAAFTNQVDATVADEARTLADEYRTGGNRELGEAIAEREAATSATRMLYAVYRPDGVRIYGTFAAARPSASAHEISFSDPREGPDVARAAVIDLPRGERLVVAADSDWIERVEKTIVGVFAAAFLGACLLGFAGAVILGGYLERRLRSISRSAEAIIGGDIRQRMTVSPRRDEFDQLAATLNRMLDRIEGLLENLRQVSSDIAHDLRTPLARLRTQLERGRQANAGPGDVIEAAVAQLDHVLSLFAAILRIAEVEAGETRRYFTMVDLAALTTELAESYAPAIQDQGRTLLWSVEPALMVSGDRELLAQAAINLIENAQRHTPPGTVIRLTLVAAGDSLCLQVVDSGPGVATSDLPRIVKRFARLETSRNTAGYGLGLSLVSAVAKLHGGRLILRDNAPGLSATIELPVLATGGDTDNSQVKDRAS